MGASHPPMIISVLAHECPMMFKELTKQMEKIFPLFRLVSSFHDFTSSTAQGGGGSFKNRKPIGEIGCCESGMAERIH